MNAEHETVVLEGMDSSIMVFYMFITYVTYCFYVERTTLIQSNRRRNSINADDERSYRLFEAWVWVWVVWVEYQGEFVRWSILCE